MLRHSGLRGASSSEPTLNIEYAAELGHLIARARADRQMSVEDVAAALLLSHRQVHALEKADPSAFYGEPYFIKALQKYLELIGVPGIQDDLFERLLAVSPADEEVIQSPLQAGHASRARPRRQIALACAVLAVAAVALLGATYFGGRLAGPDSEVAAAAEAEPIAATPHAALAGLVAPVAPEPPGEPAADAPPSAAGRTAPRPAGAPVGQVAVGHVTWVFVRYANNEVVERTIGPGRALPLTSVPIYLAVGIPDVQLTLGGELVDVGPYVANGQVRIGRAAFANLAARREGPRRMQPDFHDGLPAPPPET